MIDAIDIWHLMHVLHLLGAAVWVGGMFFAILIMRPALVGLDPPRRVDIYRAAYRRFFIVIWWVMPGMLLSGYGMLFRKYGGFADAGWNIHLMHMLGLAMAAIFVATWFGPNRRFQEGQGRAIDVIRPMITANLVLGLVTIVIAGLG
jgi:uncharacterized membrane protein